MIVEKFHKLLMTRNLLQFYYSGAIIAIDSKIAEI